MFFSPSLAVLSAILQDQYLTSAVRTQYSILVHLLVSGVISGMTTIKINSWKTQCSLNSFFFFRLFQESIFLAIAWPEKEKIRIFVWCLTDNAVTQTKVPRSMQAAKRKRACSEFERKKNIRNFICSKEQISILAGKFPWRLVESIPGRLCYRGLFVHR